MGGLISERAYKRDFTAFQNEAAKPQNKKYNTGEQVMSLGF